MGEAMGCHGSYLSGVNKRDNFAREMGDFEYKYFIVGDHGCCPSSQFMNSETSSARSGFSQMNSRSIPLNAPEVFACLAKNRVARRSN